MNSVAQRKWVQNDQFAHFKEKKNKKKNLNTGKQVKYIDFWMNYTFKKRNKRSDYADGVSFIFQ